MNKKQLKKKAKMVRESKKPVMKAKNMQMTLSVKNRVHHERFGTNTPRGVILYYNAATIVGAVTAVLGSIEFQLDQFEGYSEYKSSYDAYRLLKVKVMFFPKVNVHSLSEKSDTTIRQLSQIIVVRDYDDSTAPAAYTDLLQYEDPIIASQFKQFSVTLEPKPSGAVYAGVAVTGYQQLSNRTWIDVANDDTSHYGLKYAVGSTAVGQTSFQEWSVYVKGWFEFRQPR